MAYPLTQAAPVVNTIEDEGAITRIFRGFRKTIDKFRRKAVENAVYRSTGIFHH